MEEMSRLREEVSPDRDIESEVCVCVCVYTEGVLKEKRNWNWAHSEYECPYLSIFLNSFSVSE